MGLAAQPPTSLDPLVQAFLPPFLQPSAHSPFDQAWSSQRGAWGLSPGCTEDIPNRHVLVWAAGRRQPPWLLIWGREYGASSQQWSLSSQPKHPLCPLTGTCCSPIHAGCGALGNGYGESWQGPPLRNFSPRPHTHQPGDGGAKTCIFHAFHFLKLPS